jgi:dienelactone hydrolase
MANVILLHSAYGLRPAVREVAERLRRADHAVQTPDLYRGLLASTIEEAVALRDRFGREELLRRARAAVRRAPPGTVLAGFSMGASLALRVAASDPRFSRLLLFHGVADPPSTLPVPWSIQAHLSEDDPWTPRAEVVAWRDALERLGATVEVHHYRAGHLFTDPELPDHGPRAAAEAWSRAEAFLAAKRTLR